MCFYYLSPLTHSLTYKENSLHQIAVQKYPGIIRVARCRIIEYLDTRIPVLINPSLVRFGELGTTTLQMGRCAPCSLSSHHADTVYLLSGVTRPSIPRCDVRGRSEQISKSSICCHAAIRLTDPRDSLCLTIERKLADA